MIVIAVFVVLCVSVTQAFRPHSSLYRKQTVCGLKMTLDGLAELGIAAKLATADMRAPVSWDGESRTRSFAAWCPSSCVDSTQMSLRAPHQP